MLSRPKKLGKVTLVGAGPGDPDLLTIGAVKALKSADIILFDSLVCSEILEYAKDTAQTMLVGKRGGRPSCRQEDINALMIKLARKGKHVVRLKSGDPMIFGRGGEEIDILKRSGIGVSVIPGITAASALASRVNISLTHRDCAQAVKYITAHSRKGELPEHDWRSCADGRTTLMIYMGARTAPSLAKELMEFGLPKTTPVLIAKGVSWASEEISYCRLCELTDAVERSSPVLLGIGHVFEAACAAYENQDLRELHRLKA